MEDILKEMNLSEDTYLEQLDAFDFTEISTDKLQMMEDAIFLAGTVW